MVKEGLGLPGVPSAVLIGLRSDAGLAGGSGGGRIDAPATAAPKLGPSRRSLLLVVAAAVLVTAGKCDTT